MVERPSFLARIEDGFRVHPVVALLGPRQCGKTTLARMYAARGREDAVTAFDLEDPADLAKLQDPRLALQGLSGLVVIDEIQRMPELMELLRVLVDRERSPARFLILGSASPELTKRSSETLAGRVDYIELSPFQLTETGKADDLWIRGGFPRSFLAGSESDSLAWRRQFIRTFLERDVPNLGIAIPAPALRRFWMMLAHMHGQLWNASEIARSLGVSGKTVRGYLDILTGTYMVRQLSPWYADVGKRQVKSVKVYLRDSGILHAFLNLPDKDALLGYPRLGASWEGFALEQTALALRAEPEEVFFWSTHSGAELDLLLVHGTRRRGFEFKYSSSPRVTKSMRIALADLELDQLDVVYPGGDTFPLAGGIRAIGLDRLAGEAG